MRIQSSHFFLPCGAAAQRGPWPAPFLRFLGHTQRHITVGRTPLDASQRPLPDNTQHSQQTFMPPVGFEPTVSAGERSQTYALDRAATGTGSHRIVFRNYNGVWGWNESSWRSL